MGLPLVRPRIVPWTRKAHELLFHASETTSPGEIHESLFRTYLIEGRDIGRVDVLTALAGEHGLDSNESRAVLDVDRHRPSLERIRAQGIRAGVTTVPSLQAGEEILRGSPTEEELDAFLASLVDEKQP
jgi:predicted DsbA family dithiol-disulfide isomerase